MCPGSQDLPRRGRQVDAQIIDYRPAEEKERIYPMGAIRKISGQLRLRSPGHRARPGHRHHL
ncbi:MAG: DUF4892 domain-containing protein [Pseudomonas veronii]|nr:DUF4892 domain-containing protein [Pseudomonas veronii]